MAHGMLVWLISCGVVFGGWRVCVLSSHVVRRYIIGENTKFHRDGFFFFTSSHSVDRYQIRKYPYCLISNTPVFSGVLRCYSRGISAARMELGMDFFLRRIIIMVILDGIFEYSTPKRLAKAQPSTPHELNR
jgi:hypothetical protein